MIAALVASSLLVSILLLLLHHLLLQTTLTAHLASSSPHVGVLRKRASLLIVPSTLVESWLQEHGQQIDQVLRTVETGDLGLVLLILLLLHGSLVDGLLVPNCSHLFWVAVLYVKSELRLEENISGKLFGLFALILFLEVDEGLLRSWDDANLGHFSLTSCREIDLELVFSGSWREVLDEQTEEHDRLLVLEVLHHELVLALTLRFGFSDIDVRKLV